MKKLFISILLVVYVGYLALCCSFLYLKQLYPTTYSEVIEKYEDDVYLILSVIKAESDFNSKARSGAGAIGLMQIMPSTAQFTAEKYNVDSFDLFQPEDNIKIGCAYLRYLKEKFKVTETALAAYNAGEGTVSAWLKDERYSSDGESLYFVPYKETREYIQKIKKYYRIYLKIYLTN